MLVNASDREWRGQLSYLHRAGFLKVESDMGRRPGETRAIPLESRVNWNECAEVEKIAETLATPR